MSKYNGMQVAVSYEVQLNELLSVAHENPEYS
jgi:hypothetical protein